MAKRYLVADERREQTVRTVIDLCARQDPATLTTSEVADRMKVTQGALFRHFPNKEAIWEAVAKWTAGRVLDRLERAAVGASDPLEALKAMFNAHVAFIVEHPGVPRIMMGQFQHDRETPARRIIRGVLIEYRNRVAETLEQARRQGKLRSDLDIDAAAVQFLGTIQGLIVQALVAGDMAQLARLAPRTLDLYINGLRPAGGHS